jgi:hypothetical protein
MLGADGMKDGSGHGSASRSAGRSRQWLGAAFMGVEATAVGTPRVNASRAAMLGAALAPHITDPS